MNTLVSEQTRTQAPIGVLSSLLQAIVKAFGPVPRKTRTLEEERTLRRELWMLGGN